MDTSSSERPLRADAQRNHDRIIGAAHDAFAELGLEVSMEEIARRATVGAATLYRRFPTKQQLLRAIFDTRLSELEPRISPACAEPDPWNGLVAGLRAVLDAQARNLALLQVLAEAGELPALKSELRARVFDPLCEIFARAQASGQVRADLDAHELPVLVRMVATTIDRDASNPAADVPAAWPRYLSLLTDALRTPTPAVLPPR